MQSTLEFYPCFISCGKQNKVTILSLLLVSYVLDIKWFYSKCMHTTVLLWSVELVSCPRNKGHGNGLLVLCILPVYLQF